MPDPDLVEIDLGILGKSSGFADASQGARFSGRIPEGLDLFQDHFPDFPVLPGVLGVEILKKIAEHFFSESFREEAVLSDLQQLKSVRYGAFLKPGDPWESEMKFCSAGQKLECRGKIIQDGKNAVIARFTISSRKKRG